MGARGPEHPQVNAKVLHRCSRSAVLARVDDAQQPSGGAGGVLEAVEDLLAAIVAKRGLFATPAASPDWHQQVAAAALMRSVALLRSGLVMIRERQTEGFGVVARSAWETWLVGMYLLAGGAYALHRLAAESLRQNEILADRNLLAPEVLEKLARDRSVLEKAERERLRATGLPALDADPVNFDRLTIEAIARDLGPMLVATGLEESADTLAGYDLFYRSHSAYDSHGLPALERHLDASDDEFIRLSENPSGWIEPQNTLGIAAMSVSILAHHLFKRFEIDTSELEAVQQRLVDIMRSGADDALRQAAAQELPGDWDRFREKM